MLTLERSVVGEIISHARDAAPNECCGIIAGSDGRARKLYRALNSEASPYRYNVDPKDLLRIYRDLDDRGWEVLVIYHSHTQTEAFPSPTDVRLAAWPEAYYVIVSLQDLANPVVRAFRIRDGEISEEDLRVV